jgi:Flp pilus assembly protein TadG
MFGEEGGALVEATILAPILLAMGVYAADFGLFFYTKMEVQNAAQAAVDWAVANRTFNSLNMQNAGTSATTISGVNFTPAPTQICGCSLDPSGNLVVTTMAVALVSCTPNSPCNGTSVGSGSGVTGLYAQVTATNTYNSLVPFSFTRYGPQIASNYTFTTSVKARIQ